MNSDGVTMALLWSLYGIGMVTAFAVLARRAVEDAGEINIEFGYKKVDCG